MGRQVYTTIIVLLFLIVTKTIAADIQDEACAEDKMAASAQPIPSTGSPDDECEEDEASGQPAAPGSGSQPKDCTDDHAGCTTNGHICQIDTYSIMMVMKCAKTCQKCEAHEHLPDSTNPCKNKLLGCFKNSKQQQCHERQVREDCQWTCKVC